MSYDEEGDVLEVIFNNDSNDPAEGGYELRKGVVLNVTEKVAPTQLTIVSFLALIQLPIIHFDRLERQPENVRSKLLQVVSSPPVSRFLKVDPANFHGRIMSPSVVDACAKAA